MTSLSVVAASVKEDARELSLAPTGAPVFSVGHKPHCDVLVAVYT